MKNLDEMTDEELAMSYIDGNNRAFDVLLERNQTKLFTYIMFVVRDRETADDVFQETFVKVITRLHAGQYAATGKFSGWIMRIAHNVIMDWFRDQKSQKLVELTEDNNLANVGELFDTNRENQYVNEQVLSDVQKMMHLLPAPQREVVYMRFYQQMSFKEIAETTNVSINTSLGRMRYAILNLRRMARKHNLSLQLV